MSKLNLINLAKDELSKEEAQRVQGGVTCFCPCECACGCPPRELVIYRIEDRVDFKVEDIAWYEVN